VTFGYKALNSENNFVPRLEQLKCVEMATGNLQSIRFHFSMVLIVKPSCDNSSQHDAGKPF